MNGRKSPNSLRPVKAPGSRCSASENSLHQNSMRQSTIPADSGMKDALSHIVVHGTKVASVPFRDHNSVLISFQEGHGSEQEGSDEKCALFSAMRKIGTFARTPGGKSNSPYVTIHLN